VVRIREQLDSLAGSGMLITLAEAFAEPQAALVTEAIARSSSTSRRICSLPHWRNVSGPFRRSLTIYLYTSERLIFWSRKGGWKEAVHKYVSVAETYRVRGEVQRAVAVYRKAIETAPMDVNVREHLIQMLIEAGLIDQAIEQYMAVADAYYQLAQTNRAVEKYTEALKYAAQGDPARHWEVNVLHRVGDIYMQRVNWKQAVRAYQRIRRVDGEDEKSSRVPGRSVLQDRTARGSHT